MSLYIEDAIRGLHQQGGKLKAHRESYHSEAWAEKPQMQIDSIIMLPMSDSMLKAYRGESARIAKKQLHELPISLGDTPRPVVADDWNEVFMFHGLAVCHERFW